MNNNELQELAKLAKEKGFKTHTVTTGYTFTYLLGGKNIMINDTCIYLFLCEIQKWLREIHNIHCVIIPFKDKNTTKYESNILSNWFNKLDDYNDIIGDDPSANFNTYEEALMDSIIDALKEIK